MADDAAAPSGKPEETEESAADQDSDEMLDEPDVIAAPETPRAAISPVRLALIAGLVAVVALGSLAGWLGFRANQSRDLAQQRDLFIQVARQGAVNLTTLSYEHIDSDVARILGSATGTFYDDFQQRAPSFIEFTQKVKSTSVGTVTAAALESSTATEAEVLVAVTVKSAVGGQSGERPRGLRMRLEVQKVEGDAKVSNVELIP